MDIVKAITTEARAAAARGELPVDPSRIYTTSATDEYTTGYRFEVHGRTAEFEFVYPRDKPIARLQVGLEDVRAANDIEIRYDFERDGWVIESPTKFMWFDGEDTNDHRMEEVAFIPAYSEAAEAELDRMNG